VIYACKRSLWAKGTVNFNYLINTIHSWASRVIPLARASGTVVEKRDSANLSRCAKLETIYLSRLVLIQTVRPLPAIAETSTINFHARNNGALNMTANLPHLFLQ
jgi:hypothetical protein